MDVRFLAQPFLDGRDLSDFVHDLVEDGSVDHLDVVVAWAKRSGLSRLQQDLEAFRARGGTARLVVGIGEGGATSQGLELARSLFDSVHVFHDRTGRTFHPKVYLGWGHDSGRLLVGSHNATAGGVYFNYEAGIECALIRPTDDPLLMAVRAYIDRLYGEGGLCKLLTDAVLQELLAHPSKYRIGNEDAPRRQRAVPGAPEDLDAEVDLMTEQGPGISPASMFGAAVEPKKLDPVPAQTGGRARTRRRGAGGGARPGARPPARPAGPAPNAVVQKRWFKELSASDARHPPKATSNVTGVLRLVQAGHNIDRSTYFHRDFFSGMQWTESQRPRGLFRATTVPFHVIVNGADHGVHWLSVDDQPWREAGQANHTTVLHWGDLAPLLDASNYTGYYVVLVRLANETFRLEITPDHPGPEAFIA